MRESSTTIIICIIVNSYYKKTEKRDSKEETSPWSCIFRGMPCKADYGTGGYVDEKKGSHFNVSISLRASDRSPLASV